MMENQLVSEDTESLRRIYDELKAMRGDLTSTAEIESSLEQALKIAIKYGTDHPLYLSLQQTNEEQLRELKKLLPRSKNRIGAIADFRLFLMGDLLGWFDRE